MEGSSQSRVLVVLLLALAGWAVFQWHPPQARTLPSTVPRAPAEHRYALDGTFYLVRYAAVRTPKGIYGFEPGREVHLVRALPERNAVQITDGQQDMEIDPAFLTRDMDVAAAVRRADEAAQAAFRNERDQRRAAYEQTHLPIYIAHAQNVQAVELARMRGEAIGTSFNPLDQPALPVGPFVGASAAPDTGNTAELDPALASFLTQPAFGRLPSAAH